MSTMQNRMLARAIPYLVATATLAAIVYLYFSVVRVNSTTVALSLLLAVLFMASQWGLRVSIYTALLATVCFNFFFLPPVLTFTVGDTRNWVALGAFVATSLIASNLSHRARREAQISHRRRREAERLYEFSQQLLVAANVVELLAAIPARIVSVFEQRNAALFLAAKQKVFRSDPFFFVDDRELRDAAQRHDHSMHEDGVTCVPISLGVRPIGAFAVAGTGVSRETLDAVGGLIAIAMERAGAVETLSKSEAAREGERLRNALLDSVTHELRTPLTSITAAISSLRTDPGLDEQARSELMSVIDEESQRLNMLISQAVEMAELDTNEVKLDLAGEKRIDLLLSDAVRESHVSAEDHPIEVRTAPALPVVLLDRARIMKVLLHLIENAAHYSQPGAPIIVSAEAVAQGVVISVADRGAGIDDLERMMVFDKFYRGESQRYRVQGTGMGLAISKAIVEAHHGSISVTSQLGHGSVFSFTLPSASPAD